MTAGRILTVCEANVCRSVAAGFFLADGIARHPSLVGIDVFSCGVDAVAGHHACRMLARMRDGDAWRRRADGHRARPVETEAVERADLILTATRGSRAAVVSLVPGARRRVFTLREALWLADGYRPPDGSDAPLHDLVAHLDGARGLRMLSTSGAITGRRQPHPFDIPDGHVRYARAHRATLRQVQDAATRIVGLLAS